MMSMVSNKAIFQAQAAPNKHSVWRTISRQHSKCILWKSKRRSPLESSPSAAIHPSSSPQLSSRMLREAPILTCSALSIRTLTPSHKLSEGKTKTSNNLLFMSSLQFYAIIKLSLFSKKDESGFVLAALRWFLFCYK